MHKPKPQWRTVIVALAMGGATLGALAMCRGGGEVQAKMFGDAVTGFALFLAAVATKALGEHAAGGGGIKGMLASLGSSAKPEPPKAEP